MSQTVDARTKEAIDDCLKLLKKKGWPELPIDLEPPIGDFAVICFPAAKTLKKEPERIAEELAYELEKMNSVDSTYVEKGYCNVNLRWNEFANDVTQSTVYAWVKQEGWDEKKQLVYAESLVQIQESEGQKINRIQQEHWDGYSSLRHKAMHELDLLQFDKASDAAKALDLGIRGERQVMEGLINLQFVQNVLEVLVDEITDEDVLRRVAMKLKALIHSEEKL